MDAIETLMNEHRTIERVCDALVAFAEDVRRKSATEKEELSRFVTFVREFADAHHHGKEENVLFRAMVDNGFPREGGPVAVMLAEHDEGRGYLSTLRTLTGQDGPWSDEDRQKLADAGNAYSDLLHAHIHKEDAILYPMAEQHLPPDTLQAVSDECERYEEMQAGSGVQARLLALADELVSRHAGAVHPSQERRPTGFGCCG